MAVQLQLRRGTEAENATFIGAQGELTYSTDTQNLRIHDGATVGGTVIPTATAVPGLVMPNYTGTPVAMALTTDVQNAPITGWLHVNGFTSDAISWLTVKIGNFSFTTQVNSTERGYNVLYPIPAGTSFQLSPRGSTIRICEIIPCMAA